MSSSVRSVGGSFQLPPVFGSQRPDIAMQCIETYKDAYYSLNLAQREAVFSLNNPQLFTKYNSIHMELFKQDLAELNQSMPRVKASKGNLILQRFDFTGREAASPKKSFTLTHKDPLTELLALGSDFLKNPRRVRSKAAYLPDIWHKLLDHSPTTWQALDAVFIQILEFCFLLEFHASPSRPFDRILKLHPSPRDLELGLTVSEAETPELLDEALLDSLNEALAKPSKAKAKKNKSKASKAAKAAVPVTPATASSPTSSPRWEEWREVPQVADVSVVTKNTFLHYAMSASFNTPSRGRAQTDGAIFVTQF